MLRFVPIVGSLADNAPGYDDILQSKNGDSLGPICWKCSGTGSVNKKLTVVECKVCQGSRRLPVKLDVQKAKKVPGVVTKQTLPPGWEPSGPRCVHALMALNELPPELTLQDGEQMCVFVGDWRIIQRKGGHRWTTDDIVTAWVAGKRSRIAEESGAVQHTLDLGCGNGSVLMMVAWQYPEARCFGMEARSEAVGLARRSIQYNVGRAVDGSCRVNVTNRDFRELIPDAHLHDTSGIGLAKVSLEDRHPAAGAGRSIVEEAFGLSAGAKFDLVTGTPPYFQVNFAVKKPPHDSTNDSTATQPAAMNEREAGGAENATGNAAAVAVERAIIRQGGMPTCKESAPARCEFRGGIEAYCAAAAATLSAEGVFVVCENFANHERALVAARNAALKVISIQRVLGKEGKPPLFCVYSMVHNGGGGRARDSEECRIDDVVRGVDEVSVADGHSGAGSVTVPDASVHHRDGMYEYHYEEDLVVRDKNGAWTPQYAELLRDMSYPVASLHPNGTY